MKGCLVCAGGRNKTLSVRHGIAAKRAKEKAKKLHDVTQRSKCKSYLSFKWPKKRHRGFFRRLGVASDSVGGVVHLEVLRHGRVVMRAGADVDGLDGGRRGVVAVSADVDVSSLNNDPEVDQE